MITLFTSLSLILNLTRAHTALAYVGQLCLHVCMQFGEMMEDYELLDFAKFFTPDEAGMVNYVQFLQEIGSK